MKYKALSMFVLLSIIFPMLLDSSSYIKARASAVTNEETAVSLCKNFIKGIMARLSRQKSGQNLMSLIFQIVLLRHLRHQGRIIIFRRSLVPKGRMQLFEVIPVDEIPDLSAGIPDIFVILQINLVIF